MLAASGPDAPFDEAEIDIEIEKIQKNCNDAILGLIGADKNKNVLAEIVRHAVCKTGKVSSTTLKEIVSFVKSMTCPLEILIIWINCVCEQVDISILSKEVLDSCSTLFSRLARTHEIRTSTDCSVPGIQLAYFFAMKMVSSIRRGEDLLPVLICLKETNIKFPKELFSTLFKRLEDVPPAKFPSTLYQALLISRISKVESECFESIFAVMDVNSSKLDVTACLTLIKLAFMHEANMLQSFLKHAQNLLRTGCEASPFVLLLLTSIEDSGDKYVNLVYQYLERIAADKELIEKWNNWNFNVPFAIKRSSPSRVVTKLLDIVQADDENTIKAMIKLAFKTLKSRCSEICQLSNTILSSCYKRFDVSRETIVMSLLQEFLFSGSENVNSKIVNILSHLISLSNGVPFESLLTKNRRLVIEFFISALDNSNTITALSWDAIETLVSWVKPSHVGEQTCQLIVSLAKNTFNSSPDVSTMIDLQCLTMNLEESSLSKLISFLPNSPRLCVLIENIFRWKIMDLFGDKPFDWIKVIKCRNPRLHTSLRIFSCAANYNNSVMNSGIMNSFVEFLISNHTTFYLESEPDDDSTILIYSLYEIGLSYLLMSQDLDGDIRLKAMDNLLKNVPYLPISYCHRSTLDRVVFLKLAKYLAECEDVGKMEVLLRVFSRFKFKVEGDSDSVDNGEIANLLLKVILRLLGNSVTIPSKKLFVDHMLDYLKVLSKDVLLTIELTSSLIECIELLYANDFGLRDISTLIALLDSNLSSVEMTDDIKRRLLKLTVHSKSWNCSTLTDISGIKIYASFLTLVSVICCDLKENVLSCLAEDIVSVMGKIDADELEERSLHNIQSKFVTVKSVDSILNGLIQRCKDMIMHFSEVIFALERMSWECKTASNEMIEEAMKRLVPLANVFSILTTGNILGTLFHNLIFAMFTFFKLMVKVGKVLGRMRLMPGKYFISISNKIANHLVRNIYNMLPAIQQNELERLKEQSMISKKKKGNKTQKSFSAKESRYIPGLIFQIECFDRCILNLNALHRTTICATLLRSTARDFRIQVDELEMAFAQIDGNDTEEAFHSLDQDEADPTTLTMSVS